MNQFVIQEVVDTESEISHRHFPLERSAALQEAFAHIFSRYLGRLIGGHRFEAEGMLVTGLSGSGKTGEIGHLLDLFNQSRAQLPSGQPARFVRCILDSKGGWKDLGRKTLRALGYPISEKSRLSQAEIWERVVFQAEVQGVVGIHYDEAQHILRKKPDGERLAILDSFKTLMKSNDWPLILILSGVPELANYVREEPQLFRLMTQVSFGDINLTSMGGVPAGDYQFVHEIVGSFALEAGLAVDDDLLGLDFYHRLVTAGAFRWGLLIRLTLHAVSAAVADGAVTLKREHFIDVWVEKTGMNPIATPFTHEGYVSMFRRDRPFQAVNSS